MRVFSVMCLAGVASAAVLGDRNGDSHGLAERGLFTPRSSGTGTSTTSQKPTSSSKPAANGGLFKPKGKTTTSKTTTSSKPATTTSSTTSSAPRSTSTTSSGAVFTPVQDNTSAPYGAISDILAAHNAARKPRSAPPMTWDANAAKSAKAWAEQCKWYHGGHDGYGQNLAAAGGTSNSAAQSGQQVVDAWMSEEKDYDPSNPMYSHFTQVVWASSTGLGCWQTKCNTLNNALGNPVFDAKYLPAVYTVCHYSPPGNVDGEYGTNVHKLQSA